MAASTQPSSSAWSMQAIPVAYGLGIAPYLYQFGRGMTASGFAATNVLPRTNLELLKGKIPEHVWKSLVRARGAHHNALEVFPFFATAMVAGNWAKLPAKDLNSAATQFVTARVLYTLLYVTTTSELLSYFRSATYAWSLAAPAIILWRAGKRIREQDWDAKPL